MLLSYTYFTLSTGFSRYLQSTFFPTYSKGYRFTTNFNCDKKCGSKNQKRAEQGIIQHRCFNTGWYLGSVFYCLMYHYQGAESPVDFR